MGFRSLLLGGWAVFLTGCGLQKMLPEHPVMTPWSWSERFVDPRHSGADYSSGEPSVSFPILPVQVWGIAYELDLVVVSQNPKYDMHEFASIRTDGGLLWIAKDAAAGSLVQTITTKLKNPYQWFPEIPVARRSGHFEANGIVEGDQVQMTFSYDSVAGDRIDVRYEGSTPTTAIKKRNGSTMGHSRDSLMAVLDVSHRAFGKKAVISYDGEYWKLKKLLGVVPFRMALQQTQGGLATGTIRQDAPMSESEVNDISSEGFLTYHTLPGDNIVDRSWEVRHSKDRVVATQESLYRTLSYSWRVLDGAYELHEATVVQPGREANVVTVRFQPALPDMRRRFSGVVQSQFGVAVNGQPGMAVGRVVSFWDGQEAVVRVIPEAPWWVADRPMESRILVEDGSVQTTIRRIEVLSP